MPPADWPNWLTLREVAIVSGRSYRYLGNRCSAGLMWPPPVSDEHGVIKPLKFRKDEVIAALNGTLPRPRRVALATRRTGVQRKRRAA